MKTLFKLICCLSFVALTGCSTHGTFISEHKDAWIDGYSVKSNFADKGLHFCKANVSENGLADPVCFKARFEEYEDEKPRVEAEQRLKEKEERKKN
jgi:hypothetical protein